MCVNALAARLKVTQAAVSQHLRIMRDAGLVIDEKHGYFVHYRLNEQTLAVWREEIENLLAPAVEACTDTTADTKHAAATKRRTVARSRKSKRASPTGKRTKRVDGP